MLQPAAVPSTEVNDQARALESERLGHQRSRWFAVFTLTRHEKRTKACCEERQIEAFLPLYSVKHRWKNRCTVSLDLPLFPSYVFVRIDPRDRMGVLKVPGVISIVSSGNKLLPVPDHYITSLRSGLLAHRIEPHPNVEVGDRVRIITGPMVGMEGILERQKNELRVVLRLAMIGRSVSVEVGAEEIDYVARAVEHENVSLSAARVLGGATGRCTSPR